MDDEKRQAKTELNNLNAALEAAERVIENHDLKIKNKKNELEEVSEELNDQQEKSKKPGKGDSELLKDLSSVASRLKGELELLQAEAKRLIANKDKLKVELQHKKNAYETFKSFYKSHYGTLESEIEKTDQRFKALGTSSTLMKSNSDICSVAGTGKALNQSVLTELGHVVPLSNDKVLLSSESLQQIFPILDARKLKEQLKDVYKLQARHEALQKEVKICSNELNSIKSKLASLKSQANLCNEEIAKLKAEISSTRSRVKAQVGDFAAMTAALSQTDKLDAAEKRIYQLKTDIAVLEKHKQKALAALETALNALKAFETEFKEKIEKSATVERNLKEQIDSMHAGKDFLANIVSARLVKPSESSASASSHNFNADALRLIGDATNKAQNGQKGHAVTSAGVAVSSSDYELAGNSAKGKRKRALVGPDAQTEAAKRTIGPATATNSSSGASASGSTNGSAAAT
jgi:chromosome segregation ATPase